MDAMVPLAMFGWIPLVLGIFALLPARRAVIVCLVLGWLFLPNALYRVSGIPPYSKATAIPLGILLAVVVFDVERLLRFRPHWVDLAVLAWCICPMGSSLSNGLGAYDGCAEIAKSFLTWGLTYLIGRLYFGDLAGLRELAIGIFVGGLIYVPLCLWEIRMTPQLHRAVYGFAMGSFLQTMRYGGYRPVVFMQHGLAVGMWMMAASLAGIWLWRTGGLRGLWGLPMWVWVMALLLTTVLCKSTAALVWLMAGVGVLFVSQWMKSRWALAAMIAVAPLYMALRLSDVLSGETVLRVAKQGMSEERVDSLRARLEQEHHFSEKAMQQPMFGWSSWYFFPTDEEGDKLTRGVDSLWIIALGSYGMVGLIALTVMLLLPASLFVWRVPARLWDGPMVGGAVVIVTILVLQMVDNLFNGMLNPVLLAANGGVASCWVALGRGRDRASKRRAEAQRAARRQRAMAQRRRLGGMRESASSAGPGWPGAEATN